MDKTGRFAESAAMTTEKSEVAGDTPRMAKNTVFPWWVGLILLVPALLQMGLVPDYSAHSIGRIVGASVVPLAVTSIAYFRKSRRAVILTAVLAVALFLAGTMMQLRKVAQLRGMCEDDCKRLQIVCRETIRKFESAGGLLAEGLGSPEQLRQRQALALALSQSLTSLIERRSREGLIQTLVQGGVHEGLARREADGDEPTLVLTPRILEATRDAISAVARLLDVLSRESRWQVPEGGRIEHCTFLPGADPRLVAEGERALAEISEAKRREAESQRLFMEATMRPDESGH